MLRAHKANIVLALLVASLILAAPLAGARDLLSDSDTERDHRAPHTRFCGTKELYGKTLKVRERGKLISCARIRRIIRGRCNDRRVWACFSFRPPFAPLVWFRANERFDRRWSIVIEALRYPCADAKVTSLGWAKARDFNRRFPTRAQILADDLMRCGLLDGMTRDQVIQFLGEPDEESSYKQKTFLDYDIGPERDSFFQLDSEFFSVVIGAGGTVVNTTMYQG